MVPERFPETHLRRYAGGATGVGGKWIVRLTPPGVHRCCRRLPVRLVRDRPRGGSCRRR